MDRSLKCLIIEDEVGSWIYETLDGFSNLSLPNILRLILLGDEDEAQRVRQRISSSARVESFSAGHEDFPAYLASSIGPRDLIIMDVMLDKEFKFDGPTALVYALLELLDKRQLDEYRSELQVVFITRFPVEIFRLFDSVQTLIKNLKKPIRVIEKVGDFQSRLQDIIDDWRVAEGLFGDMPGPALQDYLDGRRKIYLNFQPIVNLCTGQIHSYEVLARDEPEGGIFPKSAFQDAYGLGKTWPVRLNMLALEKFLEWIAKADEVSKYYDYSLNVSPATFISESFREYFLDLRSVADLPIQCDRIGFELLEKEVTHFQQAALLQTRDEIRRLGYRFEIDDYGMGAAAAERLVALKPDIVKLDRKLVEQFCKERDPTFIGRSLAKWATGNNVTLVAEGVDSTYKARDIRRLINAEFKLAQGYLFGGASSVPTREVLKEGLRVILEASPLLDPDEDESHLDLHSEI